MLDNVKYNEAKRAATMFSIKNRGLPDGYFQYLLAEHALTSKALEPIGMNYKLPNLIDGIDTVMFPDHKPLNIYREEKILIEFAGLPNCGKTSLTKKLSDLTTEQSKLLQEPYSFVKNKTDTLNTMADEYEVSLTTAEEIYKSIMGFILMEATFKISPEIQIVLSDRGIIDQPIFAKAKSLAGMFYSPEQTNPYKPLLKIAENRNRYCYGLIICITTPKISVERKEQNEKIGKYTNLDFLSMLYDQYIRFYSELLSHKQSVFFPFALLDTSDQNFHNNLEKAKSVIVKMGKYYDRDINFKS